MPLLLQRELRMRRPPLQLPYLDVALQLLLFWQLRWLLFSLYVLRSLLLLGRLELQQQQQQEQQQEEEEEEQEHEEDLLAMRVRVEGERLVVSDAELVERYAEQAEQAEQAELGERADLPYDAISELLLELGERVDRPPYDAISELLLELGAAADAQLLLRLGDDAELAEPQGRLRVARQVIDVVQVGLHLEFDPAKLD